jgi:hypothetical protein
LLDRNIVSGTIRHKGGRMIAFVLSIIAIVILALFGFIANIVGMVFVGIASILAILAIYFGARDYVTAKEERIKWRALAGMVMGVCIELETAILYVTLFRDIL